MEHNYTITSSESCSSQSDTFEMALEISREMIRATNNVVTIYCNKGYFIQSYRWCFEDDDLMPC